VCGHGGRPRDSNIIWLPSIDEVLALTPAWAAELTPLLLRHLGRTSGYHRQRTYAEVVSFWGSAAAAAIPALTRLLRTNSAGWAAQALAAIGPAAASAAKTLARLAHRTSDSLIRIEAAAAHHRVTGDPDLAMHVLGAAISDNGHAVAAVRRLADVGPAAKAVAPALGRLVEEPDQWVRVEARHTLWCIDAQPLDRILHGIEPRTDGTTLPVLHQAVRYLARHIAPEPTRATLQALLDHPHRLSAHRRPRHVPEPATGASRRDRRGRRRRAPW
jgi:hypothetical protein